MNASEDTAAAIWQKTVFFRGSTYLFFKSESDEEKWIADSESA